MVGPRIRVAALAVAGVFSQWADAAEPAAPQSVLLAGTPDNQVSGDVIYGSGLRRTPDGGAPNSATLGGYTVVNAAFTHTWNASAKGATEGRLAILNLFDKSYLLRDGTGVGVGAPQCGARRGLYAGLSTSF
jgi:outer membrane receptor for Fe3+-dicitrate